MKSVSPKVYLVFLILGIFSSLFGQYTIPKKPNVLYPIYDEITLLSDAEKQRLNQKLIAFEDSTSVEIFIYIMSSTKEEDANFLASKIAEQWGIGKKGKDNGIIFLIAKDDRKMAIQKGRDIDKYLTASVTGQILDYIVTPNFKQGLWYNGIDGATTALMEAVQGKYQSQLKNNQNSDGLDLFTVIIIVFFMILVISIISRNKGGNDGNDDDDDVILSKRGRKTYPGGFLGFPNIGGGFGGGLGGGSSGGSSGGGFGGFGGGGSFGGGGASGSW